MLARPAALFISAGLGWRAVFLIAAGIMLVLAAVLAALMPRYQPAGGVHYGQILLTSLKVLRDLPRVRRRALYQSLMFGAFSLFWTAAPLALADRFRSASAGHCRVRAGRGRRGVGGAPGGSPG